jgi:hypothetical protein
MINKGIPKKEGIKAVKLPVLLIRYDVIPEKIRIPPHTIAKFGIGMLRNLNSPLMINRKR